MKILTWYLIGILYTAGIMGNYPKYMEAPYPTKVLIIVIWPTTLGKITYKYLLKEND